MKKESLSSILSKEEIGNTKTVLRLHKAYLLGRIDQLNELIEKLEKEQQGENNKKELHLDASFYVGKKVVRKYATTPTTGPIPLTVGKEYEIEALNGHKIQIRDDNGNLSWYSLKAFEIK